jgi:hypothetical protein
MKKKTKLPTDAAQRARAVFDLAIGEVEPDPPKNPRIQAAGRAGGAKGGKARARNLSPKERSQAAKKAAKARWSRV